MMLSMCSPTGRLAVLSFALLTISCGGPTTTAPKDATGAATEDAAGEETSSPPEKAPPSAVNAGKAISDPLIDDLEDGDHRSHLADDRGGYWYSYADDTSTIAPTGQFTPAEGGAEGSKFAARVHGSIGDKQYPYAGMGFNLTDPKAPYDLSSCEGISFRAKKGSAESTSLMRFKVGDVNTTPEGGVCKECYNDFGRDVFLTEEWTEFSTKFSEMKQEPYWGEPRPAPETTLAFQLQWQVKERGPFDIWVDDVKFIGCGSEN